MVEVVLVLLGSSRAGPVAAGSGSEDPDPEPQRGGYSRSELAVHLLGDALQGSLEGDGPRPGILHLERELEGLDLDSRHPDFDLERFDVLIPVVVNSVAGGDVLLTLLEMHRDHGTDEPPVEIPVVLLFHPGSEQRHNYWHRVLLFGSAEDGVAARRTDERTAGGLHLPLATLASRRDAAPAELVASASRGEDPDLEVELERHERRECCVETIRVSIEKLVQRGNRSVGRNHDRPDAVGIEPDIDIQRVDVLIPVVVIVIAERHVSRPPVELLGDEVQRFAAQWQPVVFLPDARGEPNINYWHIKPPFETYP